jgi:hypothetical protein
MGIGRLADRGLWWNENAFEERLAPGNACRASSSTRARFFQVQTSPVWTRVISHPTLPTPKRSLESLGREASRLRTRCRTCDVRSSEALLPHLTYSRRSRRSFVVRVRPA